MKRLLLTLAVAANGWPAAKTPPALPPPHETAVVAAVGSRVLVAHDGAIELFDGKQSIWKSRGVDTPSAIATGATRAAVLDELHDRVALVDLAKGDTRIVKTLSSPVAAVFAGNELLVVDRDSAAVEQISPDGTTRSVRVALDPSAIGIDANVAYVYSRIAGVMQEIAIDPLRVARTAEIAPFASAMVVAAGAAYLTYPHDGRLRVVDLRKMATVGEIRIGAGLSPVIARDNAVPLDVALAASPTPLTPRLLAIADPSARRLWIVEAHESPTQAFGRSFLRSILGMRAFTGSGRDLDGAVDRVVAREGKYLAYDSLTGSLYRVSKNASQQLATNLGAHGFAITSDGTAVWWQNGTLVAQKLD